MAITPMSLARISFNQRAYSLQAAMRQNQLGLYRVQNSLASGVRFTQPSEDPLRAASAASFMRRIERLDQVAGNLRSANTLLTELESAAHDAIGLFEQGRALSVQSVGDTISPEERQALVGIVDGLLSQLVSVGNRKHLNTYLFSGAQSAAPFELRNGGVVYTGDGNPRQTVLDSDLTAGSFTVPGLEFFGAISPQVLGTADLDPALTAETRIVDLAGVNGEGVQLGRILVRSGGIRKEIDLAGCDTVGDLVDRLNAELPPDVRASFDVRGIALQRIGAQQVWIEDVGGGRTASDLGLLGELNVPLRAGADLNARLTLLTAVSTLQAGAGLDLSRPLVLRSGDRAISIDLSSAQTVEDVLNQINNAGANVWARLSADGRTLEVRSRISGLDLHIEESGGLTATALGLRSLQAATPLASLNDNAGVHPVDGPDLRVTTADGQTFDVDLNGARTIQDVLDRLNAAGGGALTAGLATHGNGLVITDNTAGGGTLALEALNHSPVAVELGLNVTAAGGQLLGRDVNPQRVDSPFTALLELRAGLLNNDRNLLTRAGERIERVLSGMQQAQGRIASLAGTLADRVERIETERDASEVLLSDVRDTDMSEAIVRFQQLQTALQANLQTAARVMNLSLLDYLR